MADEGLTPEELAFKKKYGRLPPKKKAMKGPLGRLHHGGVSRLEGAREQGSA